MLINHPPLLENSPKEEDDEIDIIQIIKDYAHSNGQTEQNNEFVKLLENLDGATQFGVYGMNDFQWNEKLIEDCLKIDDGNSKIQDYRFDDNNQPKIQDPLTYAICGLNLRDQDGNTALSFAVQHNSELAEKFANNPGIDINSQNKWGEMPIINATKNNPELAQKMAKQSKFDPLIKDNSGFTAQDYAKQSNNPKIAENLSPEKNEKKHTSNNLIASIERKKQQKPSNSAKYK